MKMVRFLVLAFQSGSRRRPLAFHRPVAFFSSPAAIEIDEELPRRFQEIPDLHDRLKANIKHEEMTEIQAKTYDAASQGEDVLGRARTGTGKTVGFLLPALQRLLLQPANTKGIRLLVLSPTRELASQISTQVHELTAKTGIGHQVVFGGSSKSVDIRKFTNRVPDVLVATPGRMIDHLETTKVNGERFPSLLKGLDVLVLDETDRLLDMGFRQDVEKIIGYIPKKRQTLLFSATVPESVKRVIQQTMKKDFVTVDCIRDADAASHTNSQVQQAHVIVPYKTRMVSGALDIIMKLVADSKEAKTPLKVVVFLNTAHLVSFYTMVLKSANIDAYELHSRKSQSVRTRVSNEFRKAKSGILVTTDVSARGVDYPDVTHVLQIGIADSRESYIHRLGRTGRAGKMGEGILFLTDKEAKFIQTLNGMDVPRHDEFQALMDKPTTLDMDKLLSPLNVNSAMESAYRSLLGFYNGKLQKLGARGLDQLADFANAFAYQAGAKTLPGFERKTLSRMGLGNLKGLNIVESVSRKDFSDDSRGSFRSGGRGNSSDGGRFSWSGGGRSESNGRRGEDRGGRSRGDERGPFRSGGGRSESSGRRGDDRGGRSGESAAGRAPKKWSRGKYS